MFLSAFCWSAGILYALTRLDRKPDLAGWILLAFSIYSLLMTAYPQLIVFYANILTGYGLLLAYRRRQSAGWSPVGRNLAVGASATAAGGMLALPGYLDLAQAAADSARAAPDPSFFMAALPRRIRRSKYSASWHSAFLPRFSEIRFHPPSLFPTTE